MKVAAPGKLILTGAYAVLEGAPAIVMAVDRRAIADGDRVATNPAAEVIAAIGVRAPFVDASALYAEGTKLGLGSSAAVLVASLGVRCAEAGIDLRDRVARASLFRDARSAHARVQSGGSGIDVAASVHGGVLRYELREAAEVTPIELPDGLVVSMFFSGSSARTSDLRARVDALRGRDGAAYRARMADLSGASRAAADACAANRIDAFLGASRAFGDALGALGADADAPIVLPAFATLASIAAEEGAAFFPSGAGGGDVAVHLGGAPPSESFFARARAERMRYIPIAVDREGVRVV